MLRIAPNTGYRTIQVNFTAESETNYSIFLDGELHTEIIPDTGQGMLSAGYDNCTADGIEMNQMGQIRLLPSGVENIECTLTGMIPNQLHSIEVYSASGLLLSIEALTELVMSDLIR